VFNKTSKYLAIISVFALFLTSCGHEEEDSPDVAISSNGSKSSHNTGQNCLNCHQSGNEYIFSTAGTVYQQQNLTAPLANVKIVFHDGPNASGNLIYSIEVDALGNFYTTDAIAWENGLYVSVEVPGQAITSSMSFTVNEGACGRCHAIDKNITTVING
jgi:hypothetical protein